MPDGNTRPVGTEEVQIVMLPPHRYTVLLVSPDCEGGLYRAAWDPGQVIIPPIHRNTLYLPHAQCSDIYTCTCHTLIYTISMSLWPFQKTTYLLLSIHRASSERSGASGSAHVWTNTLIICSAQIHLSNAAKGQALLSFSNLLQRGKIQKLLKKSHPQNTCTMTCILSSHFLFLNTYNITFEKWGTEFLFRSFLNF